MHRILKLSFAFISLQFQAFAQTPAKDSAERPWSFSASSYYYFVPSEENFLILVGYADYKSLHLEARYNYEDMETFSGFVGWNFETGEKFQASFTPMLGFVVGNTEGIAPGLELELNYKIFDFYAESEYLFDFAGKENNYIYTWLELGISPFKSFRTGLTGQRTRTYETKLDVQRGIFAEYSFWKLTAGAYYFNPFSSTGFVIAALSIDF